MKNFYKVSNTIENGPRMDRQWSRISPINHRIWSVIAPMLFVAFGLFGVNEKAWGYWRVKYYCTANAYVIPSGNGDVWVTVNGTSFNGTFASTTHDSSDRSGQDKIKGGGLFDGDNKAPTTYNIDAQFYAAATYGDYVFKGWYDNAEGTGTAKSTSTTNNCSHVVPLAATKLSPGPNVDRYAIYAKYKTTTTEIDFGDVAYNSASQYQTFTIDCHNVGTWSNPSGLSNSVFSASLSGNSDDNSQHTCTVTVTINPTTAGTYNKTLQVTTSRGGTINVTVKAKVTATPSYTWNSDLDNLYVGQTINNVIGFTSSGAKTYSILNWTPTGSNNEGATTPTFTNNTLVCGQAGTLTLKVEQAAETNGFDAGESTKNITIKKIDNTLTVVAAQTKKVDETVGSVYSNMNSDATVTTYSTASGVTNEVAGTIAYLDVSANTIRIPNSGNVSFNEKAVTVHVCQAENYKYKGIDKTVVVTVQKYDNALKTSFSDINSWSKTIGYGTEASVRVESNHTQTPIVVTHKTGNNYSTYNNSTKKVTAGFNPGTDTWEFSQAESYKYKAATTQTMTVGVQALPQTCYLLEMTSTSKASEIGEISLNGVGVTLYFDIDNNGLGYNATLSTYNGSSWTDEEVSAAAFSDYVTRTKSLTDDITKIKFGKKGTDDPYIKNIYITRKTWLTVPNLDIRKQADNTTLIYPTTEGKGILRIDYSLSNGGELKLYCDNDKFTFTNNKQNASTPITISSDLGCSAGVLEIPVYYNTDVVDVVETAHVVVYNSAFRATPTITGLMVKRNQTITWKANFDKMSLYTTEDEAATTNVENLTVTYTSDDESIIQVTNNGTRLEAVGEGTTTIHAHTNSTAEYNEGNSEKEIEVTPDLVQYIVWNQSLMNMKFGDPTYGTKTLNAYATSDIECATNGSRSISYTSLDPTIASVNGNVLTAHKKGTTTIIARQEGGLDADGHKYVEVTDVKTVVVRDPNEPCTPDPIFTQSGTKDLYQADFSLSTLQKPQQNYDIDLTVLDGKPGYLSFYCRGEYFTIGKWTWYSGHIKVAQRIKNAQGEYVWDDIQDVGEPTVNVDNYYSNIPIDTTAIALRIYRPEGGEGHHKIHDAQITLARYMKGIAPGTYQAKVGETQPKTMVLEYSNIVGPITISMLGTNSSFSVDQGMTEPIDGECGGKGKVTLTISYNPQVANEDEHETMRVTDGTTTVDFPLSGVASVTERTIVWLQGDDQGVVTAYTVETPRLTAYPEDAFHKVAGKVYYDKNNNNTAGANISVVGTDTILSFTSAGQVYVTAYPVQDDHYNTPASVTKRWDVSLTPTEVVTAPTIGSVVSGTALSDITVSGGTARDIINHGSVSGTFTVQNGNVTDVGPNKPVTVKFTPEDGTMYDVCTYNMYIEVTQRPATDEEIGTVTAGHITFGEKLSDAVLSMSGTLNGHGTLVMTDPQKDEVKDVDTYENLKVLFTPDNTNIAPKELTVSVTVDKANPAVTPQATDITYGQPISASNITTASGDVAGSWAWAVDDTQVLSVGDHVLNANFTSDSANYNNLSNVDVTLKVKKIEKLEVEVPLSFCAGESETFHGNTYSEAGEYQIEAEGATRDTVYNVTVTVLQPTTGTDSKTITVGDNESWHEIDLSGYAVGSHEVEYHITNVAGCDSTVTLSLTVNKIETLEVDVPLSFCAGGSETFHGKTYTTAGTDQINAIGATRDTIYNVTVTVLQPTTGTDSKTITVGDNESWHGIDLSSYAVGSHEVEYHTTNVAGCDSTVTLSLTVNAVVPVGPNTFTNNAGDNDWQNAENWTNGVPSGVNPDVIISGALIIDESVTVGGLTILPTGGVTVITHGTLTVNGTTADQSGYGDLYVKNDGAVILGNSANLQVRDFKLDASLGNSSNAGTSGQVSGDSKLHVNGDAYFQMSFDVSGQITYGWYDFVVPFEVDALNGVLDANGVQIVYGTDYIIMNHSEEKRARNQKAWNTFTGTLEPGRIYTITFEETKTWNTFLFKKKAGSDLVNSATYTSDYSSTIGETQDRGWNGFGNGTLQHRELTNLTGISKVQMYNHTENRYDAIDNWNEKALAVGTAFSIQVAGSQSIVLETADANKPLRAQASMRTIDEFRLTLTAEGADYSSDRMWVSASDEATGDYVIGHDLLKMGTPTQAKVAQMWAINNNLLLCDIEMPMANDMAQCMLGLFAPNAGQYILAIDAAPEDANLYLTYNGNIIWDLTASPYVLDLTKGTTTGYGLRIEAANAPQITTGVEDVQGDGAQVRKVIIDNKMYIITPEGAIFNAIGKKVQ